MQSNFWSYIFVGLARILYSSNWSPSQDAENMAYGEQKDRMAAEQERTRSYSGRSAMDNGVFQSSRGVSENDLLPFGSQHGDSKLPTADDNFEQVTLQHEPFVFFNSSYNKMWVNNNGAISFLRGVKEYTPKCGPLDTPMIVPFWADVDTRKGGSVYYRQTTDSSVLDKVAKDVRKAFPNSRNLNLKWVFITTFDDVAFFGAASSSSNCPGNSLRNKLQIILVRDAVQSFVLFYYNKIEWTTGTASNGNQCTGVGGTPAKAGFDYGDGKTFFTIPNSCQAGIINVAETSNFLQNGKWAFRVTEVVEDPCEIKCEKNKDYYVNPFDCTSYYHCSNGWPILRACPPPGLVFDPTKDVCVWPNDYPCQPICQA